MMDTVSVVILLSFPFSVMAGWACTTGLDPFRGKRLINLVLIGLLMILTVQGILSKSTILDPQSPYVRSEDLMALKWIKKNTPPTSYFMVNTFNFDFDPDYIIGSDSGYWMPLLGNRRSVTFPMIYGIERMATNDLSSRLISLHRLHGDLTSSWAIGNLKEVGITHVFIGARGGSISPNQLSQSPYFNIIYKYKNTYVFKFLESKK